VKFVTQLHLARVVQTVDHDLDPNGVNMGMSYVT